MPGASIRKGKDGPHSFGGERRRPGLCGADPRGPWLAFLGEELRQRAADPGGVDGASLLRQIEHGHGVVEVVLSGTKRNEGPGDPRMTEGRTDRVAAQAHPAGGLLAPVEPPQ